MATRKEVRGWSVEELIESFEKDINLTTPGFYQRFDQSSARHELCQRGRDVLRSIIDHIRQNPPDSNLEHAWWYLFNQIKANVDLKSPKPKDISNIEEWIRWAEKFAV